ncbi:MAG: amidohydrolase family protein [Xanthobacteraceae bacterium]
MPTGHSRRKLLGGAAAAVLAASISEKAFAQTPNASRPVTLPKRGEYLLTGALVMTMDSQLGNVANGFVHVKDGTIVDVGPNISLPGVEVIGSDGMIVMPGLIDTHWHLWTAILRGMATSEQKYGYFPTSAKVGQFCLPGDIYCGVRLATAEAIWGGITFVDDWAHNLRTPEHADENLRALRESGLRGRFNYGPARGIPITQTLNLDDLKRRHQDWSSYANDGLLSLGLAWRGVQYAVTKPDAAMSFQSIPKEVYQIEYDAARSLGIPITVHCNIGTKVDVGHVAALDRLGLLYPDLQLVHMVSSTPDEIQMVAKAGCPVSSTPYTEMRTGFGFPPVKAYLDAGVRVGLGIDTTALSGDANMFEIMKGIQNIENAMALSEFKMPARRAVELGTIEAARSVGLDSQIGSIAKGKRADIILIDTQSVNLGIVSDPYETVVGAVQPANVDSVMVDGRILKRGGKLVALDAAQIVSDAKTANIALRARAGWW